MYKIFPSKNIVNINNICAMYVDEVIMLDKDGSPTEKKKYDVSAITFDDDTKKFVYVDIARYFEDEESAKKYIKEIVKENWRNEFNIFRSGNAVKVGYISAVKFLEYQDRWEVDADIGAEERIKLAEGRGTFEKALEECHYILNQ